MDEYNPQFEEQKTDAANTNPPTFEQPGVSAIPHSYVTLFPTALRLKPMRKEKE